MLSFDQWGDRRQAKEEEFSFTPPGPGIGSSFTNHWADLTLQPHSCVCQLSWWGNLSKTAAFLCGKFTRKDWQLSILAPFLYVLVVPQMKILLKKCTDWSRANVKHKSQRALNKTERNVSMVQKKQTKKKTHHKVILAAQEIFIDFSLSKFWDGFKQNILRWLKHLYFGDCRTPIVWI